MEITSTMEIRELRQDELDLAVLPCADPGFRKTLNQGIALRREFLRNMMGRGLSILAALEDEGEEEKTYYPGVGDVRTKDLSSKGKIVAGLIEYLPIEETNFPVKGRNLVFIHCIWVIPPFWRKGVATSLIEALHKTARLRDFSGAAVIAYEKESWWGFFDYMPGWFFRKFGFKQVERDGNSILMLKSYKDAKPPQFILPERKTTSKSARTKAQLFWSGQCPYSWWVKKLAEKEFGKNARIELSFVNTDDRKTVKKSGITFGLAINGKIIYNRIPSWDEVKTALKSVQSV
jgi:GNAT superfamily N-acetyltransferase